LLRVLGDAGVLQERLVEAFFRHDHYADPKDYLLTVETVWGSETAWELVRKLRGDERPTVYRGALKDNVPHPVLAWVFLIEIPAPDFLTCLEIGFGMGDRSQRSRHADTINQVCRQRGIPYRLEGIRNRAHFVWTGDAIVNEQALRPALSALDDSRLAQGPRQEFEAARHELRQGTPGARKQAVAEACNAVESALRVFLEEHGQSLLEKQTLDLLLNACVEAGLIAAEARELVAGPGRFGNRRGRHGAGAVAHNVTTEEAETVVSAAAVAITFIAKRLP
jgi:hypothetical protein